MTNSAIISLILIIINVIVSYKGFKNEAFFDGYKFEVDPILVQKDYKRIITSGFLHGSWKHLIGNMISLYLFSNIVELYLGSGKFLIVYFSSLIGSSLFSLFMHRNHGDYSAVGASGAVCGVIFASIALFPGMQIFFIPSWLFGILYVLFSIYCIKSAKDNIGHDAHLGGAIIGMLVACALEPAAFLENYDTILIIAIPTIIFIYFIVTRPYLLLIDNLFFKKHENYYSIDHKYNADKNAQQREIDFILDKISKKGLQSLTKKEKEKLEKFSKSVQ